MNKVTAIVAVDANMGIGKGWDLLFKNSTDMAWFAGYTMGKACIVGWNTYKMLPALTGRDTHLDASDAPPEELKTFIHYALLNEVVVIGGAKTYSRYADQVEELYITKFFDSVDDADVFFPVEQYEHLKERVVVFKNKDFVIEKWT